MLRSLLLGLSLAVTAAVTPALAQEAPKEGWAIHVVAHAKGHSGPNLYSHTTATDENWTWVWPTKELCEDAINTSDDFAEIVTAWIEYELEQHRNDGGITFDHPYCGYVTDRPVRYVPDAPLPGEPI